MVSRVSLEGLAMRDMDWRGWGVGDGLLMVSRVSLQGLSMIGGK